MANKVCLVCKAPIDEALAIPVPALNGFVHPGECLIFLERNELNESEGSEVQLNEVELLM